MLSVCFEDFILDGFFVDMYEKNSLNCLNHQFALDLTQCLILVSGKSGKSTAEIPFGADCFPFSSVMTSGFSFFFGSVGGNYYAVFV